MFIRDKYIDKYIYILWICESSKYGSSDKTSTLKSNHILARKGFTSTGEFTVVKHATAT